LINKAENSQALKTITEEVEGIEERKEETSAENSKNLNNSLYLKDS